MTEATHSALPPQSSWRRLIAKPDRLLLAIIAIPLLLAALAPPQALASLRFTGAALSSIAPFLLMAVLAASWIKASGADRLVAHAFTGRESRMVLLAALFGALSPFCSCGVIPLISGLLGAGVPLAPVMAFWIASPIMDPNMFLLTAGGLGLEFAVAKTFAAIGMGLFAGFVTMALMRMGGLSESLRRPPRSAAARRWMAETLDGTAQPKPVWRFWHEPARAQVFVTDAADNGWKLLRWMTLAFLLESLMVAYLPGEAIATWLGAANWTAMPLAVIVGVPAYLNGYAAIPLVAGLIELGMNPAVGLAFMTAGGVSSIPAMMAVWGLVRRQVFVLYLALGGGGALLAGYGYALWLSLN
ncbi:permease [Ferrovibrio sp.]|uniref:permease n=1 Tax=Ferrovibrio sp. TaxID=1917215 RepID=UPI00262F743F|nr:permease [Ferrovibrio sp.]